MIYCAFVLIIFVGFVLTAIMLEKVDYNNGVCPDCNTKLRNYDTDSQGGRDYICDNCNYNCWVSYNMIDKNN